MTRAALVGFFCAAATLLPSSALASRSAGSTLVVRGVIVQYIPPSGSVVGSLSVRVVKVNAPGRALLGELVTVAVERGDGLESSRLLRQASVCTLTLKAPSPASVLKGAADVQSIVPSGGPAAQAPAAGSAPGSAPPRNPDAPGNGDSAGSDAAGGSSDRGSSQPADHHSGQGNEHTSGQGNDSGSGPQARNGGGGSNAHK